MRSKSSPGTLVASGLYHCAAAFVTAVIALVIGLTGAGCGGEQQPTSTIRSALGEPVRTVHLPASISCPQDDVPVGTGADHVAISVAVVPASVLDESPALPDDKALLATSCRNSEANGGGTIYFVDPGSNDDTEIDVTGTIIKALPTSVPGPEGFPRFGWGALAFRGDVDPPDLLACANPDFSGTAHGIYSVNLTTGVATKLFDAAAPTPGKPFCDGLAWDSFNDTIWMSPDVADKVHHYINRNNPGPRLDLPDLDVPTGCFHDDEGNSGIAVVGPELFLACDGEQQIFRIRQSDHAEVGSFSSGAQRAEDLECDGLTFASGVPTSQKKSVLWTKEAFRPEFLSFNVPPGTCGLCRQSQRLDLSDDLTGPERTRLFQLLLDYITTEIVAIHQRVFGTGTWHGGNTFFAGHRGYIGGFELWLLNVAATTDEEKARFVPLPKWTPEKIVPGEFEGIDTAACNSVSGPDCSGLAPASSRSLVPLPGQFKLTDPMDAAHRPLCDYASLEEIRTGGGGRPSLEGGFHSSGHCTATGGTMCQAESPSAPIFWPWHALLDDIARDYECVCRGSCNTCTDLYRPPAPMTTPFAPNAANNRRPPGRPGLATAPIGFWFWFEDEVFPEDLSPNQVVDHAGFFVTGDVHGGAKLVPGLVGQTLDLDGRNDFVEVKERGAGDVGSTDFSLDAWIKTSASGFQPIIEKKSPGGRGYELFLEDGQFGLAFGAGHDESVFIADATQIADGQWHHVAAVVSRSDSAGSGLFVDGQLALAFDATSFAGDASSDTSILIGRTQAAHDHHRCLHRRHHHHGSHVHGVQFFNGQVDEIDLFRYPLSKDLVASIFVAGSAGKFGSAGNLPTGASQPLCVPGLGEKIDMIAGTPEAAVLEPLYQQVVAAIAAGNQGLARRRLRTLRDQSLVGHEQTTFLNMDFHAIHGHANRCLGLPILRLN